MEIQNSYYNITPASKNSFRGLTSKLSSGIYSKHDVKMLYNEYVAKSHGIVGKLPSDWVYSMPFDKRKENIKEIFHRFGALVAMFRKDKSPNAEAFITDCLKDLFIKTNVLKDSKNFSIKFLGEGSFAKAYKLNINDKSYAVKVFNSVENNNSDNLSKINGNFYEQALAQYVKKKIPLRSKNIAYMYFGDMTNGIQVSEFCDKNTTVAPKTYDYTKIGLLVSNVEHYRAENNIANKIIDYGCMKPIYNINNKYVKYIGKNIDANPEKVDKFIEETIASNPSADFDRRIIGIHYFIKSKPELIKQNFFEKIMPKLGEEASEYIAGYLENVPEGKRVYVFSELLKKKSNKVDVNLAQKINLNTYDVNKGDPEYLKFIRAMSKNLNMDMSKFNKKTEYGLMPYYEDLLSRKNPDVNMFLANALQYLPKEKMNEYYNSLYEYSNEVARTNLAYHIQYLPEEHQAEWMKKLAKNNDKYFFCKLYEVYPLEKRRVIVERSFEVLFDEIEPTVLAEQLSNLPQKDMDYWFNKFYALNREDVNEILLANVNNLPISKLRSWEDRLF